MADPAGAAGSATGAAIGSQPLAALVAALTSWLPLSANWIGPAGWWLGWIYVAWVWGNLAVERYADAPVIQHVHQLFSKQIKWKPTAQ